MPTTYYFDDGCCSKSAALMLNFEMVWRKGG